MATATETLPVLLRVGCVGLVLACNAVMWTVFAKALRLSSSSAAASVTMTASNFISSLPVLLRVGCVGLVLACNAVMWTVFAKALRLSSSSAAASVTMTASNFISSAMLGRLLFGETWTPLWWVGLAVTLCGLVLLHTAAPRMAWLPVEKKEA
ncbi:PREDICTED: transmembrane protein 42 [Calidris pugnax]|uniref:transmembrane protein 42 n=1 Tax=Calidris pugnax TaxID=198806 RepID=UPI00071DB8A3|nr:PREDICTED: transmembrane protein 42 [Calidris pugnax]